MNLLILTEKPSDLTEVLQSCGAEVTMMTFREALHTDLTVYDAYCVLADGKCLDARVRMRLEEENDKGKRVFTEAIGSYRFLSGDTTSDTTRSRLICMDEAVERGLPLEAGDLLDDESNVVHKYMMPADAVQLLVYRERIVAHDHTKMSREEILDGCIPALWLVNDHTMMCAFRLHNFNRARFAPRARWQALIIWIAQWLTGKAPEQMPEPVIRYGVQEDLNDPEAFEKCRAQAIERGMQWIDRFLVDNGEGGILEGLNHNIDPEGKQTIASTVRTDCSGEAAGAYYFYGTLHGDEKALEKAKNLQDFCHGPMQIRGGIFDGMLRWTENAWGICFNDDTARTVIPELFTARLTGSHEKLPEIYKSLDFLVKTTAKDGVRDSWTKCIEHTAETLATMAEVEHYGYSAHHNAWYAAAMLLAYQCCGEPSYLETARKCIETLMSVYPDTEAEHSQTEEAARLVLPLAILYEVTGEEKHREMLYQVVNDLCKHRYACGGYAEWDEKYAAACSRESTGECSLLTENGDPVADLLYTCNWLPVSYAWAWYVTKDRWFYELWEDIVRFCIRAQNFSSNPLNDGSWCRAFDMERMEAYACPHDAGWAANASESGWTNSEILMGMMMPDMLKKTGKMN